jgi:threonine synthase
MSYLSHLECSQCGSVFDCGKIQTFCEACQTPLLAVYEINKIRKSVDRDEFRRRPAGLWRWQELLPVRKSLNMLTLGEGDAPLLPAPNLGVQLGLKYLYVKEEGRNPTGSFKARGLAAAVSKAKELGLKKVIIPTAGNAGGAMTAYAARAGLKACVVMPEDTPRANIEECRIMGADVRMVSGLISDAAVFAKEKAKTEGWFDLSTFKEPYRVEGKKIMGFELAESFSWHLPDVIVYPTGGGTGLIGMWKAFQEMDSLGWLVDAYRPRMVAVQAEGCAPVTKAFEAGESNCEFWDNARTIASGLRVPKSFADRLILKCLYESHGTAVSVSDDAIFIAQKQLATAEGIFACPEGAATLAGLNQLLEKGWVKPDERVIIFNTGTGLKYI